jgi:hypothetical protein
VLVTVISEEGHGNREIALRSWMPAVSPVYRVLGGFSFRRGHRSEI